MNTQTQARAGLYKMIILGELYRRYGTQSGGSVIWEDISMFIERATKLSLDCIPDPSQRGWKSRFQREMHDLFFAKGIPDFAEKIESQILRTFPKTHYTEKRLRDLLVELAIQVGYKVGMLAHDLDPNVLFMTDNDWLAGAGQKAYEQRTECRHHA